MLLPLTVVLATSGWGALTWSWDTVQTYVHCANRTGAWSDAALQAMSQSQFVVFEKNTAEFSPPVIDGGEDKIVAACRQLKAISPETDCYMYTESDWARQYYSLGHNFTAHPEWCLRAADGSLVNTTGRDRNPLDNQSYSFTNFAYDFSVPEAREAWVHRVSNAVATGGFVDGAFIDGNRGGWSSSVLDGCSPAKKQAWSAGLNASHAMLRDRLGPEKVLISNYPTSEALEWCSGGMVERFTPDQHQQDLQALAKAGKLADIHAQYFKDMATSPHLAAFLVGMGKWSYFGAGSGWDGDGADACATWLKVWPEYSKPLGEPLGPATVLEGNGKIKSIWTRKFKSGTHVFLNTTDHPKVDTFCIWWSDGSTTGNDCQPSTLEFVRMHDKSDIKASRAGTPAKSDDASIVWISSPTLPNETAVVQTAAELGYDQLRLCSTAVGGECRTVPLQQSWARGAKFTVPADLPLSVWSVFVGPGPSAPVAKLNDAEPWFSMCDVRAMPGAEMTPPTSCIPGHAVLRVFGRSLAFANGQCVAYGDALTGSVAGSSLSLRLSLTSESNDSTTVTLNASAASCYTAEFQIPSSLSPGNWSWSVQNNLLGASFTSVLEDLEQRIITVSAAPSRQDEVSAITGSTRTLSVPPGDVKELLHALDTAKRGFAVALPAGTWNMGALDRLTVNDGVTLRGAGESTVLRWPTQTGAMCASFKWVNFGGPGLVSGPANGSRTGWAVTDLQIAVTGGLQQNVTVGGTRALCPIVTDQPKRYGSSSGKMRLERVVITAVSTDYAGVDMWAGGTGMGAAVVISGSDSAVRNCTVTHLGNCGSNVTPLLSVSGNRTIISGNTFHFGCTLYSMRSILALLWEHNTALHYKTLGRDGAVIATFSQPFRVEHAAFFGNKQVDNPAAPPGCTPKSLGGACTRTPPSKCTGHRLETMTLDGGGGAYTGFTESSNGTELVLSVDPFGNGTGSYQPRANQLRSKWWGAAAMILAGTGAGQWRHIVSHSGRKWVVDREWDVPPDKSSQLQISPMRGKILLINNSYTTGYTVQLYAMCVGAVVAENTLNSTPLISWGRNPHSWGYQPNWRVELLHNRMPNSHGMMVQTSDQSVSGDYPWVYRGPLASAIVLRHNWVNGSGISIGTGDPATGPSDVLVEWNLVSRLGSRVGWAPIHLSNQTHVMQRANTLFTENADVAAAAATTAAISSAIAAHRPAGDHEAKGALRQLAATQGKIDHTEAAPSGIEVDVEAFGAKADGKTECSAAFVAALRNVSSRGGGIVHARGKGTYVVMPIQLQNNTVLQIAAGTSINATHNCPSKAFPTLMLPRPPQCGGPEPTTKAYPPCGTVLFAANVHNFSVRGGGSIDGGGMAFDLPPYTHPRGPMLQFWMSSDAVVEDLSLFNSANTHISPVFCQRMQFRRLYAYSDFAGPHHKNTDGWNPSSSSDMELSDSYIHNGDDCISVKSGKQPAAWTCDIPSANILVKNVTCAGSHGLTIGSEVAGGIRNVTFLNVAIHGADGHPSSGGIKFKLPCGRGAYVKDVLYENVTASNVASGIMLAGATASCSINATTVVSNVTIRNVRASRIAGPAYAIDGYSVEGRPASYTPFSLRLENVTMVDYAQLGSCSHATVQAVNVNPAVPMKDASCAISHFSSAGWIDNR